MTLCKHGWCCFNIYLHKAYLARGKALDSSDNCSYIAGYFIYSFTVWSKEAL